MISIQQDLPLKKMTFGTVADLFAALEEQNLFVVLHEMADTDVSKEDLQLAQQTQQEFQKDPSSFANL